MRSQMPPRYKRARNTNGDTIVSGGIDGATVVDASRRACHDTIGIIRLNDSRHGKHIATRVPFAIDAAVHSAPYLHVHRSFIRFISSSIARKRRRYNPPETCVFGEIMLPTRQSTTLPTNYPLSICHQSIGAMNIARAVHAAASVRPLRGVWYGRIVVRRRRLGHLGSWRIT